MRIDEIVFFTTNPAKIKEAKQVFDPLGICIISHEFNFIEIQSNSQEDVLRSKVDQVRGIEKRPFLVDDSGFYLKAYPNFPGVMSKFIYQTIGYSGILRLLTPELSRRAFFRTVVDFGLNGKSQLIEGQCIGRISDSVRGTTEKGFLFEPIFIPDGGTKTMAEMGLNERRQYSYRAKALKRVADYISNI